MQIDPGISTARRGTRARAQGVAVALSVVVVSLFLAVAPERAPSGG